MGPPRCKPPRPIGGRAARAGSGRGRPTPPCPGVGTWIKLGGAIAAPAGMWDRQSRADGHPGGCRMFDPYHKWLGIPREEQPPDHYRLLGISPFETDPEVIDAAANRHMAYLQGCATGTHALLSQRLLNEVAAARLCLLTPDRKATYDARLRAKRPAGKEAGTPIPPSPGQSPAPGVRRESSDKRFPVLEVIDEGAKPYEVIPLRDTPRRLRRIAGRGRDCRSSPRSSSSWWESSSFRRTSSGANGETSRRRRSSQKAMREAMSEVKTESKVTPRRSMWRKWRSPRRRSPRRMIHAPSRYADRSPLQPWMPRRISTMDRRERFVGSPVMERACSAWRSRRTANTP